MVLKEISQKKDGSVTLKYWDYGNSYEKMKSKKFSSLDEFRKSTFSYWLIKNDNEKE